MSSGSAICYNRESTSERQEEACVAACKYVRPVDRSRWVGADSRL